ncbi:MAG: outer membrane beta-barrel protein [Mucilaginibacter sp.]
MKKTFTLFTLAFLLLLTVSVKAQVKSYVGFFGGLSTPQSDFAKTDYSNNKAGFAKTGVTFGLDGAYYFYKNLGIGATIAFHDQGELNSTDANTLATGYTASFAADQSTVTAVDRYHYTSALLGPQYSFTYGKFIFDLRASAGILKVSSTPSTQIALVGVIDQTKTFSQQSASATVLGYGGNLGIRYKLSDGVTLALRGAYIDSQGPSITNNNRTTDIGRIVTRQPITALQTTIGLTFGF